MVSARPQVSALERVTAWEVVCALETVLLVPQASLRLTPSAVPWLVVWLVPSLTILDQTVKALSSPEHPYRKRLDQLFQHRVAVFEKRDLLMGAGFSYDTAQEQLSIVVMSFDSLRARNKEDRKIYQENGNLASFLQPDQSDPSDWLLPEHDASALINVIRRLRPVVVVGWPWRPWLMSWLEGGAGLMKPWSNARIPLSRLTFGSKVAMLPTKRPL